MSKWPLCARLASAESLLAMQLMAAEAQTPHTELSAPDMANKANENTASETAPKAGLVQDPVLAGFRRSIDNIDAALIHMLAERFRITQAVGAYKASTDLPASDPGREARQIARLRALAVDADLDPEFSEKFIRFVIDEVIRHHRAAANG